MPLLTSSGPSSSSYIVTPGDPPALADWTYQYKDNGILINGPSSSDFYDVQEITGLDMPTIKLTTIDTDGRHGSAVRAKFFKERTIVMTLCAYAVTSDIQMMIDDMKANLYPDDNVYPFYFKHKGVGERVCFMKSNGLQYNHDKDNNTDQQTMQVTLVGEDPRAYSIDINTITSTFPFAILTGRTYPRTYPRVYGAEVVGGSFNAYNDGSMDTLPVYTLTNDINNLTIYNETTGSSVFVPIVTAIGDTLVVDTNLKKIFYNGVAYGDYTLTNGWPILFPKDNQIQITAIAAGATASIDTAYRSAWS